MINVGKVAMIQSSKIIITDRTRKEMGDLDSLENNLKESGLISPLAVMDNKDGTYTLLAGERRFTVLSRNNVDEIPARIFDQQLSELEMKIIEKSENFHRKDFEYWELDQITLEIHQMKQQLHGAASRGPGGEGWKASDTAEIIGQKSPAAVTQSIKRAEAREMFPELFEDCKSASDATKMLKKMDEALLKQALAEKIEKNNCNSTLSKLSNCFIISDFFTGVKQVPAGSIHLVEIDPPYAIDIKDMKRSEGESQYNLQDYNEIPSDQYQVFLANLFRECYRVMAEHSWLLCWFAPEPWFDIIYQELNNAGFETTRMCGIWTKPHGQSKRPEIKLSNAYEMFFYAWKGRPALNRSGHINVFNTPPIHSNQKTHPTERPVELMKELYDTFAFPGSRIMIPFLGSGNGLISAYQLGMSAFGFELGKSNKDSFLVKVHGMR